VLRAPKKPVRAAVGLALVTAAAGFACFPGGGPTLLDPEAAEKPPGTDLGSDAGLPRSGVDLGDPFALEGLTPSHGPFTGGTRATLSGRGFSTRLRVFLGDVEVPSGNVLASDPTRAAIVTPAGAPGFVDVRIRDEATAKERILPKGFFYDAFVVQPTSGATSGGTRVVLTGSGTSWVTGTQVAIGGVACASVAVTSATAVECVTPPGAPGAKDVTVTTPDGAQAQAREAFTYSDSPDGYRGGLSGSAFTGTVRVLALDAFTGVPIAGAKAIAGSSLATAVIRDTSTTGVAEISGLPGSKVTITVAAKCHQPITYVDVPVDTVTTYLSPVLDPDCAEGDPPSGGGRGGRYAGIVSGELVFPGKGEFEKAGWTTVPAPTRPTERRAAYVFEASSSPSGRFELPPASVAVTPDASGANGYGFELAVAPGNVTLYVVAGLEDRSETPPRFMPYAMGVARGVSVPAQTRVTGVDVAMDVLFDKQVVLAPQPPAPGPRGPDRLASSLAMTLGASAFAILPRGSRTDALPAPAEVPFVGAPSLDNAMAGEQYVLGAIAATGPNLQRPASVVTRIRTRTSGPPVALGGFLGVPVLTAPATGTWSGTHVAFTGATGPVDFSYLQISSGGGLVVWSIVAPGGVSEYTVPDLAAVPSAASLGLVRGPITSFMYVARIEGFAYGRLRSGQLQSGAWSAYAVDALSGAY
jgi:hypothetical protein